MNASDGAFQDHTSNHLPPALSFVHLPLNDLLLAQVHFGLAHHHVSLTLLVVTVGHLGNTQLFLHLSLLDVVLAFSDLHLADFPKPPSSSGSYRTSNVAGILGLAHSHQY
jgi:hypothetical protein